MIRVQAAVPAEHGEDALLVLARELAVQGVGVHRLGEQLGDVPAGVGHDPAARDGLAVETVLVVEEGRAVVVGEDLQLDPELLAVAEDRAMVVGDAGRPHVRVQVIPAAELHPLPAVGFLQHVTPAGGEAAPPARPVASRMVQWYPAFDSSRAAVMPEIPAPRIAMRFPRPESAGRSGAGVAACAAPMPASPSASMVR